MHLLCYKKVIKISCNFKCGHIYKEPEPTSNDVTDNIEVNGFENTIRDDTSLGRLHETVKRLEICVNRTVFTELHFEIASLCR